MGFFLFLIELVGRGYALNEKIGLLKKKDRKDFSRYTFLPGTEGNPFDSVLRFFNRINQIHTLGFIAGLMTLAYVVTFFQFELWIILSLVSLIDFLIISSLPKWKITFGPPQSQVFLLFILRVPFIWIFFPLNLEFQILGTVLVLIGFVYEPSQISITKREIFSSKIRSDKPVRFVQLGDIHLERPGMREQKLLKHLTEISPDFILFTGDFLNLSNNSDPKAIEGVANLFDQINQIAPTVYVAGSPAVDLEETFSSISARTKAKSLQNESYRMEANENMINLVGLECSHQPNRDSLPLKKLIPKIDGFTILLYHSPDLIYELNDEDNIQLMLSGHTHGGQVRLPFIGAILTGSLYQRKLQSGLYQLGNTILSISRGIGFEGMGAPRVRLFCKPEIIQWTIKKQE